MVRMIKMLDGSELGPALVQLVDGEYVARDAERWRLECEARAINAMQPASRRQAWLTDLEAKRGVESVDQLRDAMTALREAGRA